MDCGGCQKPLPSDGENVKCSKCKKEYHYKCNSLSESSWKSMSNPKKAVWRCVECRGEVFTPNSGTTSSQDDSCSNSVLETKLTNIVDKVITKKFEEFESLITRKMEKRFAEFETSLQFISDKMGDISVSIKTIEKNMVLLEKRIDKTDGETLELKKRVRELEVMVHESIQKSNNNKLELSGFPGGDLTNTTSLARNFLERVKLDTFQAPKFTTEKITKNFNNEQSKFSLILGFETQEIRNSILDKIKKDKIKLKIGDLKKNDDTSPVYANEYLTQYYRRLFYEAKKLKKDKQYAFLWVKDGKILLKKSTDSKVMHLQSMTDLAKI